MLYTRKGDGGSSSLFGTKDRVKKSSDVYHALGTVDELNSLIGIIRAMFSQSPIASDAPALLLAVQEHLFIVQAELAGAGKAITSAHVAHLEAMTDRFEQEIENPHAFIIPGSSLLSAYADYARTVARRAERTVVALQGHHAVGEQTLCYLNRLSSFFYALARAAAVKEKAPELSPSYDCSYVHTK